MFVLMKKVIFCLYDLGKSNLIRGSKSVQQDRELALLLYSSCYLVNSIFILQIIAVLVWIGVGVAVIFTILYPPVDKTDKDFVRNITGLECHQLERYILDMEYSWDKVIEYHSFKCIDSLVGFEIKHETVKDNIVVGGDVDDVNGIGGRANQ